jgi:hypothetical protein
MISRFAPVNQLAVELCRAGLRQLYKRGAKKQKQQLYKRSEAIADAPRAAAQPAWTSCSKTL